MKSDHDVLIIGSGASGGMAAYTLTRLGVRCLMLDAGPPVDFDRHRTLKAVYELPYRGLGEPGRFPHVTQATEFNANIWADERQNPYTYDPQDPYYWVRVRLLGGKTLFWGRASWRLSDFEFRAKDHDGYGDNWPITYKDLAPYYDRVEPLLRVTGRREGLPQIPDGIFLEDNSADSISIQRFVASAKRLGIPTTKPRRASGTLASSVNLLLPHALATGNLTIVPNAIVREITLDRNTGRANGVHYIDRRNGRDYFVNARSIMLGASCLESTRILLNSNIANSSGVLGHYLFDQFYVKNVIVAIVPDARGGRPPRGLMGGGGYIPRFRNLQPGGGRHKFIRGYAYDFSSGAAVRPQLLPLYGEALQKEMAALQGAAFTMTAMGEVLPRKENFVCINKDVKDAWGIPVLHIRARYTDNEFEMARDAMEVAAELCRGAGFELVAQHSIMVPPGESIHELGTCRMGADPKTSVLNKWNQSHDVPNLFVIDGSAFVTGGSQNPTLTIAALAMRAGEYLAEKLRQREL
jgi:choline dehydrogenase-like flavoprotein